MGSVLIPQEKIASFCAVHHISKLALFGSVIRGNFGPESDIDVLVEFESGHVPGFFRLFEMEDELSALFGGRRVEIKTPEDLSPYFRDSVLKEMRVEYVQG
jgi:hypothetical protein